VCGVGTSILIFYINFSGITILLKEFCWPGEWFTAVILVTQEAEIMRILVQSQPRNKVLERLP
jgi:hypothetical protein